MPFELSEGTLNTDEWDFDENANGDGVITHKSTGATFEYNSTEDQWEPSGGIAASELNGGVTGNSSLTDIASSGLEIASNGLQILSSIWDDNNSEITADVNNSNTTTDTLEAGKAIIDNETKIDLNRSSESSLITAGSIQKIYDTEVEDRLGELNTSLEFNPQEGADFLIDINLRLGGNTSAGDEILVEIRNITDGSKTIRQKVKSTDTDPIIETTFLDGLSSSKTYSLTVSNLNSDFKVVSTDTEGKIRYYPVQ